MHKEIHFFFSSYLLSYGCQAPASKLKETLAAVQFITTLSLVSIVSCTVDRCIVSLWIQLPTPDDTVHIFPLYVVPMFNSHGVLFSYCNSQKQESDNFLLFRCD